MSNFNTIHVFAYGETQIIGKTSGKVKSSSLTTLQPLINHIKSFKPSKVIDRNYNVIHIHQNQTLSYLGKGSLKENTSFTVKWKDLDQLLLATLIKEIEVALA
tara:strand:- start:65 stop:373 length:309 start_codon:yes stop_codon:yes gene_type:complete